MKTFIAFLLIVVFILPMQAQQSLCGVEESPETAQEEPTLTPEEEEQVREIAKKFIERFEDNKDVLSLSDDFYVNDFVLRLRDNSSPLFFISLSPELWKGMTDSDVKRFYFRSLQFGYYGFMVYSAKEIIHRRNQNPDENEYDSDIKIKELLPPEVISLIEKDEFMRAVWDEFLKEENGEKKQEQEEENNEIKTNKELQSLLKFFDDAIPLMKSHLESLDAPHKWKPFMEEESKRNEKEIEDKDFLNPRVTVLTREFFGAPEGTRLICVDAMFFHMDLVKADGKLKILNLYLEGD